MSFPKGQCRLQSRYQRGLLQGSDYYADDGPGAPYERTIPEEAEYVECGAPVGEQADAV